MPQSLRWGILGTGNIARQFADGLASSRRTSIAAVGSRSRESSQAFAASRKIPMLCSYDELLREKSVDAIYNSLPNSLHHEWTIKALNAGKHVLCEKPFALDLAQSQEMIDTATRQGRVLVEAFMYRSHPLTRAVRDAVNSGLIGQLRLIRTSFCYRTSRIDGNIRYSRELAGGSLMDVGCYCINYSRLFAAMEPDKVHAVAQFHSSGVDDYAAGALSFADGVLAIFSCGMSVQADNTAYLCGTEGYIEVPIPWKPGPQQAVYYLCHSTPPRQDLAASAGRQGGGIPPARQAYHVDAGQSLYALEADDFAAAVQDGAEPAVSPQDTLGNMRVLDEIRRQIGLTFQ